MFKREYADTEEAGTDEDIADVGKKEEKQPTEPLNVRNKPTRSQINRVEWDVTVPYKTALDDLLDPKFWANVSGDTFYQHRHNKVAVHWEGGKQYAELYVRQSAPNFAVMALLGHWTFSPDQEMAQPDLYSVSYTGPVTKYRVVRKSDMQHMRDGLESEDVAYDYIKGLGKGL